MILLFGEKAQTSSKNTGIKNINNPVENSGILANNTNSLMNLLNAAEYDNFIASNPVAINYAAYSQWQESGSTGFMSGFFDAVSTISAGESAVSSYSDGGFSGACSTGGCSFSSSGSFSSVC